MNEVEQMVVKLLEQEPDFDQVDYGGDPVEDEVSKAVERGVPAHIAPGLVRYIKQHAPTGGFLKSVLENDLLQAVIKADTTSARAMRDIVTYLYNHAPYGCWGSKEAVKQWLQG